MIVGAGVVTCPANTLIHPGTVDYGASASQTFNQIVNNVGTSTILITSSATIVSGQTVTYTATVTQNTSGTATGNVEFKRGSADITLCSTQTLNNGIATCSTAELTATGSPDAVTAVYRGDANFTGSTSNVVTQIVSKDTLSVQLTRIPNTGIRERDN